MKIAVLGANGKSGQVFVNAALASGHQVYAGIRHNNTLLQHHNLHIINCDATNIDDVRNLITGCDAVVSMIGHGRKTPANMQTDAIKSTLQAMQDTGVKRIVSLTGNGVRFPGDKITLLDRFLNFAVRTVDPKRISDGFQHVGVIEKSDLDWSVLRVMKLHNSKPRAYSLQPNGPAKLFVSRQEVASATLTMLQDNSWVQQAPIISKA